MHRYRTHTCGELGAGHLGQRVRIAGWVHTVRNHGRLVFVDLRDHYGVTQCVVTVSDAAFAVADRLASETVVAVTGNVVARSPETVNPNLPTGHIEVSIEELEVLSQASPLPLPVAGEQEYPEEVRLRYRYLDLRRERLHRNITLRSRVISRMRALMTEAGFLEIQTPILTRSSPEGARDYLVPSRIHPGRFYALPQAPQIFKQLLMVSGFDRYFQIAPCFRDEESRADRSPGEFYQLDIEMSFVDQDDVLSSVEPILMRLFREFSDWPVTDVPFPRISYADAMLYYGSDKPDLRNPLRIADVTAALANTKFRVFGEAIQRGSVVRALRAPAAAKQSRSFFDDMVEFAKEVGIGGLGYIVYDSETPRGPLAKFFSPEEQRAVAEQTKVEAGDAVFFVCAKPGDAALFAGKIRTRLAEVLDLIDTNRYEFCWIVDFPMYELAEDGKTIQFMHNPFSMPQGGIEALESKNPLEILAYQYDIVCNGVELSSGAIRNHRPDIMKKAFAIAGYPGERVEAEFGGMLQAFRSGAPPHGGLAPGVDRIVMLLAREPNLREVVAFPLNQKAEDLMLGAPTTAEDERLRELHLRVVLPKK